MRRGLQFGVLATAVALSPPGQAAERSPLTDSTDVAIGSGLPQMEVENSLFVSPTNPRSLLLSNRLVTLVNGSLVTNGVSSWLSTDGGRTWGDNQFIDNATSRNPSSVIGRNGKMYVNYNEGPKEAVDRLIKVAFKSSPGAWGVPVVVLSPDISNNPDGQGGLKNHMWIDNAQAPATEFAGRLYSAWKEDVGPRVVMRFSEDGGNVWELVGAAPIGIDPVEQFDHPGVNLHTGPAGQVYAAFNRGIPAVSLAFRRSLNGGLLWQSGTGGMYVRNITGLTALTSPKSMMVNSFPSMVVDQDSSSIYIAYAEQSAPDKGNIYVIKSTNQGNSWTSAPIKVNQDTGTRDQWHPWLAWDNCTGALAVVFHDSRDVADRVNTYVAISYPPNVVAGPAPPPLGHSWSDFKVSDVDWDGMPPGGLAGDYIGIAASDGMAIPVWSDDRAGPSGQGNFRPFASPILLWGIVQSSITDSLTILPGNLWKLKVTWNTNIVTNVGGDVMELTPPPGSGIQVDPNGFTYSMNGTTHVAVYEGPCQPHGGSWTRVVKSKISRCSTQFRKSNPKTFKIQNCLD